MPVPSLVRSLAVFSLMHTIILLSSTYVSAAAGPLTTEEVAFGIEKFALEQINSGPLLAGLVQPLLTLHVVPDGRPLAPCAVAPVPAALDLRQRSRLRLTLSCPVPGGWRREYVVRATLSALVLVTAQPLGAGRPIAAADVMLARRDISAIDDSLAAPAAVEGQGSRRALRAGEVLRASQLQPLPLVIRGEAVLIVAGDDRVQASMAGEALDSGARGTQVRVRNASSGTVIRARVVDSGTVAPLSGPPGN